MTTHRRFAAALLALGLVALSAAGQSPVGPDGTRAVIDLPAELHMRNTGGMGRGGPGTGAGLCVFTSIEVAARWQGLHEIDGLQKWMTRRPGGGWPKKVEEVLADFCREKGAVVPAHVQHTGGDPAFMELILRTRRAPCMTVMDAAHMLNGMHLDQRRGSMVDNNAPGQWQWTSRDAFLREWGAKGSGRRGGWVFAWLGPPPPPGPDAAPPPGPNKPRPKPLPAPRPCPGPNCPRWVRVTYGDGSAVDKLYDGDTFLGALSPRGWHPAVGPDSWLASPQGQPPVPPPASAEIDWSRIDTTRPRYWLNGEEVPAAVAYGAVGQAPPGALADDSDRCYLTVVGPYGGGADQWDALRNDPLFQKVRFHAYTDQDWPVRYGRVKAGVTLQGPDGGVRFFSGKTTPDTLGEALKYTDPAYTPAPPVAPTPRPKPDPKPEPAPPGRPAEPQPDGPAPAAPSPANGLWAIVLLFLTKLLRR